MGSRKTSQDCVAQSSLLIQLQFLMRSFCCRSESKIQHTCLFNQLKLCELLIQVHPKTVISLTKVAIADPVGNLTSNACQLIVVSDSGQLCLRICYLIEDVAVQLP